MNKSAYVALLAVALGPSTVAAQQRASNGSSSEGAYKQARTPDGQPDIRGYWSVVPSGTISIERQTNPDTPRSNSFGDPLQSAGAEAPREATGTGASRIVDPPDGYIPYQPGPAEKAKEIARHYNDPLPHQLDPQSRCWLQGVPRAMYQSETQFVQMPTQIVFLSNYAHTYRVVPLDNRPRLPERLKLFMGDSRGRWEGSTLVIETTNNSNIPWFAVVGSFHSDALRVEERITRVDENTIDYVVIIEDPKTYTRPWTMRFVMKRNTDPDWELWEEACIEGNRSLQLQLGHPSQKQE